MSDWSRRQSRMPFGGIILAWFSASAESYGSSSVSPVDVLAMQLRTSIRPQFTFMGLERRLLPVNQELDLAVAEDNERKILHAMPLKDYWRSVSKKSRSD